MQNDNKKTDIEDEQNQLGKKNDNPTIDESIKNADIAFTPGETRPMISNIYTKSGITASPTPLPKQGVPIRRPLTDTM